jgi:hypothetical protein
VALSVDGCVTDLPLNLPLHLPLHVHLALHPICYYMYICH